MVLFNYSTKELTAKIVYYGPGLCGKTTNLQYIHANLPGNIKGKMLSLATKTDRTLFFDFLPLDLGMIRGMKTRVQLYTVPGQVFYNETRKLVLKGADGIVFVADSQETMAGANVEAFKNLEENLRAHGLNLSEMPHVIQFNKRDLPRLSGIEEMNSAINRFNAPFYESVATNGIGVQDTLKAITKLVLLNLTQRYDPRTSKAPVEEPTSPVMETPPAAESSIPMAAAEPQDDSGLPLSAADVGISSPESGLPLSTTEAAVQESPLPPSMTLPEPPDFGVGASPPSDRASFMDEGRDETPDFGESDIDDLVGEVGERENTETPVSADPVVSEDDRIELEVEPSETPESVPVDMPSFTAEDTEPETIEFNPPEPVAPVEPVEPVLPSGSALEVDRNFDPEWQIGSPEQTLTDTPAETAEDEPYEIPSEEAFDLPTEPFEPVSEPEESDAQDAIELPEEPVETVRLTDVVEDDAPLAGSGLDIVRLAAGGVTEIVLPVELGTGEDRKRFKLALNFRLDRVD